MILYRLVEMVVHTCCTAIGLQCCASTAGRLLHTFAALQNSGYLHVIVAALHEQQLAGGQQVY